MVAEQQPRQQIDLPVVGVAEVAAPQVKRPRFEQRSQEATRWARDALKAQRQESTLRKLQAEHGEVQASMQLVSSVLPSVGALLGRSGGKQVLAA